MVPLSHPIADLFSQETLVREQLWLYLIVVPVSYGLLGNVMLLSSALNALKKTQYAFAVNLLRLFGLLLPFAWLGKLINGTEGLFIGIAVAHAITGLSAYLFAKHLRKQPFPN